jgi:ABC-type transport system involved in multi-copper enzyme maturation permease subunit
MAAHGLPYRPDLSMPVPAWRRWWPLARQEFGGLFRTRWGVALCGLCLLPLLAPRLVFILVVNNALSFGPGLRTHMQNRVASGPGDFDPQRVAFYLEPVLSAFPGMAVFAVVCAVAAARSIARDRAANALELLLTRGISPFCYFLARWLGAVLQAAVFTVGVPLVLWLVAVLLAEDWSLLFATAPSIGVGIVGLLVATSAWIGICCLLSAISSSPSQAVVLWLLMLVGTSATGGVLARVLREPALESWVGVWQAGAVLVRALCGAAPPGSPLLPAACLLSTLLVAMAVLASRRLSLAKVLA